MGSFQYQKNGKKNKENLAKTKEKQQKSKKAKELIAVEKYKYWAFISYSHQDKKWGDWLHKALEKYKESLKIKGKVLHLHKQA